MPHREGYRNRIPSRSPAEVGRTGVSQVALLASGLKQRNWNVNVLEFGNNTTHPDLDSTGNAFVRAGKGLTHTDPSYLHGKVSRFVSPSNVAISTQYIENGASAWKKRFCRSTSRLCSGHTSSANLTGLLSKEENTIWVPKAIELATEPKPDGCRKNIRVRHDWEGKFVWLCLSGSAFGPAIEAFRLLGLSQPEAKFVLLRSAGGRCGAKAPAEILPSDSDHALLLGSSPDAFAAYLVGAAARKTTVVTGDGDNTPASISEAMTKCMGFLEDRRSAIRAIAKSRVEAVHGLAHVLTKWENINEQLMESEQASVFRQSRKWLTSAWSNSWRNS